jgi:tRNA threonylcarbamoyl adenosine modification protein (Sua5/YciO/YrdC/YwlC family)
MTQILGWQNSGQAVEVIPKAVEMLARGGTVAFPTETGYVLAASGQNFEAVNRLVKGGPQQSIQPLLLAVRDELDAVEWVGDMSLTARRLARRCWPGPLALAWKNPRPEYLKRMPETVRSMLATDALVLACPARNAFQSVIRVIQEPLVLSELAFGSADQIADAHPGAVDLVLDDGVVNADQPMTIVQIDGESWTVQRPGAVSEDELRRRTAFMALFVCTGNTCRSPLAEALCKKQLASRLNCEPAELPERGFLVLSAGLAAMMGGGAAAEAVETARELGADLTAHQSRPLSPELARQADCILAMTRSHLFSLVNYFPEVADRCRLLNADGLDIADPIGCDREVYRQCAAEINQHLEKLVAEW